MNTNNPFSECVLPTELSSDSEKDRFIATFGLLPDSGIKDIFIEEYMPAGERVPGKLVLTARFEHRVEDLAQAPKLSATDTELLCYKQACNKLIDDTWGIYTEVTRLLSDAEVTAFMTFQTVPNITH